ncbi:unnamed protein product [Callosobruchus maculatus]|uniref:Uncharacterized protein n=1 Tax=Callosobruchus maculatus TaxID=64391 RepID=A0A653BJ40_CALMS|nr:unnamed protein product [Callosobruchus maculatus]
MVNSDQFIAVESCHFSYLHIRLCFVLNCFASVETVKA